MIKNPYKVVAPIRSQLSVIEELMTSSSLNIVYKERKLILEMSDLLNYHDDLMSNVEQIYPYKARSVRATDTDTDRSVQRARPPDPYLYPMCDPYPFQALQQWGSGHKSGK